ncbi:MAG: hypothetical protein HY796_11530 [Elusimicrobia bacterium]|nr:hypothetical protein [Elusimicrobiota bacterium]
MGRKILLLLVLAAASPGALGAQQIPAAPGAEEAEISARMQEDLSRLLAQLVGKEKSRAFVNVEGESVLKSKTESGTPPEAVLALPGYAQVSILEKTGEYIKQQKAETQHTTEFRIKKISVSIIFDRSVPDAQANAVKLLVSDVLRLNNARGDSLIMARADMLPWWKNLLDSPDSRRVLLIAAMAAVVILIVLLFAYTLGGKLLSDFFDYARINAIASQPLAGGPGTGGGVGAAGGEGPQGEYSDIIDVEAGAAGAGLLTIQSAFDFIEKLPPKETAELLGEESDEDAAVVIANMADKKPHISSRILLALDPVKRQLVTSRMVALKAVEPEKLMEIENNLRLKLEKSLKGAEKLGRLLSLVDEADRSEIMDNLARVDAAGAGKLRDSLVTFDDICRLDDKNLRPVVVSMPYKDWATALQGAPDASVMNVLKLFPDDIKLIVKDMLTTVQEKDAVINSRARVLSTALELSGKGKIEVKAQTG